MMTGTVQQKLLGLVMRSTLAALLVAIVAMVAYDLLRYHRSWIADLDTQAELLGAHFGAGARVRRRPGRARKTSSCCAYRPKVRAAAIYNARGKLFASFGADAGRPFPSCPRPTARASTATTSSSSSAWSTTARFSARSTCAPTTSCGTG